MSRVGNFSSSEVSRLTGIGSRKMTELELVDHKRENPKSKARTIKAKDTPDSKFYTYVEEKYFERQLGRMLNSENYSRPTAWGTLVEEQAFNQLGLEYSLVSKERYRHPDYSDYWSGMPDIITEDLVGDIKSPWTMKSFCKLVEALEDVKTFKEEYPEYYWQLVSNSILCDRPNALIIIYCPYQKDLVEIRKLASDELDQRFAFINWAEDEELPYLIEGGFYNDLNTLEFEVPQEDKDFLTSRIELAIKELNKMLKT